MDRLWWAISILLFILTIGLSGCETMKPVEFQYQSQILAGGQHSFAVYNDQHRLISDPLSELYAETNGKPISDVYVISHGWNFTLDEAYANYHNYMELLDRHLREIQDSKKDPTFQPYFIYVVWPSVARPLGDIAHALLPFTLDKAIAPLTNFVDSVVFHVPSGWKESLNAFSVALGKQYPGVYEEGLRDLGSRSSGKGENQSQAGDRDLAPPYCGPEEQRKTERRVDRSETPRIIYDSYQVDIDRHMGRECPLSTLVYHILRWRSGEHPLAKIHLVGHSYGAKVVTLAGMEAIRLQRAIGQTGKSERGATEGERLPSEQSIASLVLFNPAFHPQELRYWVDGLRLKSLNPITVNMNSVFFDKVEPLQDIPRKAILYSSRDYATGRLFDVSQLLFSNDVAQWLQVVTDTSDQSINKFCHDKFICADLLGSISRLYSGVVTMPVSVLSGVLFWSGTKIVNIPSDWISHVRQDDFYGFKWSTGDSRATIFTRGVFNTFDYWMPLGRLVTNADADKMGILRTAIPALGSIGMDRLVARRWYTPNEAHIQELIGKDTDRRPGGGVDHDFCKVAGSLRHLREAFDPHRFYSYDATSVMDKWTPGAGSHGDVRSTELPSNCNDKDVPGRLEKRRYMFNFTYNFTRTPPVDLQAGASDR